MKQVLYIGGKYISTISELKELLRCGNMQLLKEELVVAYKDGTIKDWIHSQDIESWDKELLKRAKDASKNVPDVLLDNGQLSPSEVKDLMDNVDGISDGFVNDVCKSLYKVIMRENLKVDLSSAFAKIATLKCCKIGGREFSCTNSQIVISGDIEDYSNVIFCFETIQDNSDEMSFSFWNGQRQIGKMVYRPPKEYKTRESFDVEFPLVKKQQKNELVLKDGKGCIVCTIKKEMDFLKNFSFRNELKFNRVNSKDGDYYISLMGLSLYNKMFSTNLPCFRRSNARYCIHNIRKKICNDQYSLTVATKRQFEESLSFFHNVNNEKIILKNQGIFSFLLYNNGLSRKNKYDVYYEDADYLSLVIFKKNK